MTALTDPSALPASTIGFPLRILMTVARDPDELGPCYLRALANAPCEVRGIVLQAPTCAGWTGLGRRALRALAPEIAFHGANEQLLAEVEAFRPAVVWIFKGMEVYPHTLLRLRKRGVLLANYNADHPFSYYSRGTGNRNVYRSIPAYHLHMTYSRRIARELRDHFPGTQIVVVPFGHDISDERFLRIQSDEEILRACFIGTYDDHRRLGVEQLLAAGIPVDVYGSGWQRLVSSNPLLRVNGGIFGDDMLRTARRYRVQLNFFRPHNKDSHNMRSFEIPACGGIMLAEDSVEHREFFEHGSEAFFFSNPNEMVALARHLLALPKSQADGIRHAARRRCVESKYSYRHRAEAAFTAIAAAYNAQFEWAKSHS